jgi:hypothetical protein
MIDVPNPDLRLKPGMTANLKIEVAHKSNVLRVPNTSIRFRPSAEVFQALNQPVPPEVTGRGGRGGRGGQGGGGNSAANAAGGQPAAAGQPASAGATGNSSGNKPNAGTPSASLQQGAAADTNRTPGGRGGSGQGGGGGGRGGDPAQRLAQFKAMPPDRQQQFIARLKDRGQDTSAFEAAIATPASAKNAQPAGTSSLFQPKYGTAQSAASIDALFAPLPTVDSRGRVWLYVDKQLKPVNVRLGVTDGTNTELLSNELQENMQVVTGVTGVGTTRPVPGAAATGNPFQPQRGGGGGRGF